MKRINLSNQSLNKDWSMQFMDDSHYDTLIDESVEVYQPDGEPLMVLVKNALSKEKIALAWSVLKKYRAITENRSTASGIESQARVKKDGTVSNVHRVPKGWEVESGIIGYFERNPRMPYCHPCSWNDHNPEKFQKIFPLAQEISGKFSELVPKRYAVQQNYCNRTHSDFIIPGTVYTTITVNKNFRTACHLDAGDLAAGFSSMFIIKQGAIRGGNLVLPNWKIGVKLDHNDLIFFNAHEWHGNTQIVNLSKDSVRCSLVLYYREMMEFCMSMKDELDFAKNRKTGEPLYDKQHSDPK